MKYVSAFVRIFEIVLLSRFAPSNGSGVSGIEGRRRVR
jgi:hypothetical protein